MRNLLMDELDANQDKKDLPERPLEWLSQVLRMHPVEIILAVSKFKEASRRAHFITLVLAITLLVLLGLLATRV